MCGIFGILNFQKKEIDLNDLKKLGNQMIHRGPDAVGFFKEKSFGFGMRRLSIVDIEGGNQPIFSQNKKACIVFNGEIYNYQNLRDTLINKGYRFKTSSDTEVIVQLYQEMGRDCVKELNGMFSFAIWDFEKKQLWIARDRLGIKPIYWHSNKDSFSFSSDLLAFKSLIKVKINQSSIIKYLGYGYIPSPHTIFKNIFKLEPGCELVISGEKIKKNKYWSLQKTKSLNSYSENKKELKKILNDAIKIRFNCGVPFGILLSGGLDSSSIASIASNYIDKSNINAYNVNYIDKSGKDSHFARQVAKKFNFKYNEQDLLSKNNISNLDELLKKIDEPVSDNAILATFNLSKLASKQGLKVLISGAGADEIFGGYDRHLNSKKLSSDTLIRIPKYLKYLIKPLLYIFNPNLVYRIKNKSRNFFCSISGSNLFLISRIIRDKLLFKNLLKDFDENISLFESFSPKAKMKVDLENYLPENILSITDKATMASSIECRVPFLDHRLVEFCFSIKESQIFPDKQKKGMLKDLMKEYLPQKLLHRDKEGFNAHTHSWFMENFEHIREDFKIKLSPTLDKLLNKSKLERILLKSKKNIKYSETFYSLFLLNRWLNIHKL